MLFNQRGRFGRGLLLGATIAASVALAPTGASAGFFDQLFGGGTPAPSSPSFGFEPQQSSPEFQYEPLKRHAPKKIVHIEEAPQRQKTTDLWHDKTLRPGDAIMMKDGMHVFRGASTSLHMAKEFVPVDHARVPQKQRAALVALDTTRGELPKQGRKAELLTGRSASLATPITEGIKITDARGASIRYVGP